ncbi:MAG TPA: hypothetical protein VHE30_26595 [Polyangiaceae bacterium]|nr:hypothetical protein [Polyangiaceae bacterium]
MGRLASSSLVLALVLSACSDDGSEGASAPSKDDGGSKDAAAGGSAGSGGSGGKPNQPDAGSGGATMDSGSPDIPQKLSETGLFADLATETLGDGVRAYEPRYKLWSDGAVKRRWFRLPPGAKIDTTDMDFWKYPVGTTAWKEFALDGKKLETRMLRKLGPKASDWLMLAYQWNDAQTEATALPDGAENVAGTPHDIPSSADCQQCHGNMKDRLLGVSAIQLSHQLGGMTITDLISEDALSDPPPGAFTIPGPSVDEQALGYLHANCGHCHNGVSAVSASVDVRFWELTGKLSTVEDTEGYRTTVLQPNSFKQEWHVIEPGDPDHSELFYRISRRGGGQMPPLATEFVDPDGMAAIRAFIESMPRVPRDGGAEGGAPDSGSGGPADAATKD